MLHSLHSTVKEAAGPEWPRLLAEIKPRIQEYIDQTGQSPMIAAAELTRQPSVSPQTARVVLAVGVEMAVDPAELERSARAFLAAGVVDERARELLDSARAVMGDIFPALRMAFSMLRVTSQYDGGNIMIWTAEHMDLYRVNGKVPSYLTAFAVADEIDRLNS